MWLLANVLALSLALVAAEEPKLPQVAGPHDDRPEALEVWDLTLPEAIRISLDHSRIVRVVAMPGQPTPAGGFEPTRTPWPDLVITRVNADPSVVNFSSAIQAHIRSIEQQYWALWSAQINLKARETAVKLGEEILVRERAELELHGGGRVSHRADVAEAQQQLDTFQLERVTAAADVITIEKQLRNILGLASSDGRRIVPSTGPAETKLKATWAENLAAMNEAHPEITRQRQRVGLAELKAIVDGENPATTTDQREANKHQLANQQESLRQTLSQSAHALAWFGLEVDSICDQLQAAQRLETKAKERFEAQRAFYDEGRITPDRLLDAMAQEANATSQVAQLKATLNTAIAALEEAKGTLLSRDRITIVEVPAPAPQLALLQAKDDQIARASFDSKPPTTAVGPVPAKSVSITYKLRAKLGFMKVLEVELEVGPTPVR